MKAITVFACLFCLALPVLAGPPPIPATPAAVDELVYVQPFTLGNGFKFCWCAERPTVSSGTLLVLKVDKDLVFPRQVAMPVLYVGDQTAEMVNFGHQSGHLIAIVPGEVDLTKAPVWFGTPDLPERVDAAKVQAERALAEKAGIKPFSAQQVKAAQAKGGARLTVADKSELLRGQVSRLILKYSPQDKHLAEGFQLRPVTSPLPKPGSED